jgi:uncharacterized protein YecT (DUF1311 family)
MNLAPLSRRACVGALVAASLLLPTPGSSLAATPSFLCSKAKTWVEKTICGSDRLSELDLELALAYARVLKGASAEAEKAVTRDQHHWWAARSDCRKESDGVDCLAKRYEARIDELKARPDYTEARPGPIELPPERLKEVGEGWSKSMGRYLKAIRACMSRAPVPVRVVTAAWDTEDGEAAGVRMRADADRQLLCIAMRDGSKVLSLSEPNAYESLPAEGPFFYPDFSSPPKSACGAPVQILDESDAPAGWLGPKC